MLRACEMTPSRNPLVHASSGWKVRISFREDGGEKVLPLSGPQTFHGVLEPTWNEESCKCGHGLHLAEILH